MRRFGVLLILLAGAVVTGSGFASAQVAEPVVMLDSIAGDPAAYRRVLDKFKAGTVRPSYEECATAYYGFALQDYYSAEPEGEAEMQRAVMAGDYESAYLLGLQVLEKSPVNLTALYWTLDAATEIRQPWEERNSLKGRYNSIVYVISRSGDGITPETAFRVICTGDMYTYLAIELELELASGERRLWDGRWMEFEVKPSQKFNHTSIFFDTWTGR